MTDTIKFLKIRDVKSPSRANTFDAGIDFYIPTLTVEFVKEVKEKNPNLHLSVIDGLIWIPEVACPDVILYPHERILIPSGIHCQMANPGRALIAANKSGVATKQGLVFGAQVVDYEYQGEIHISLINTGNENVRISSGMKAIQFLETPIYVSDIVVLKDGDTIGNGIKVNLQSFYKDETTRKDSGFGSSDKK